MQGSPLRSIDLERCRAHEADCAIIMTNMYSGNVKVDDYRNILSAFAVKKYALHEQHEHRHQQRICLQIAKPEHKKLFYHGLAAGMPVDDQVLCVEELKLKLLAKSSVCPGIITIIWSLITSDVGDDDDEVDDADADPDDALTEMLNN